MGYDKVVETVDDVERDFTEVNVLWLCALHEICFDCSVELKNKALLSVLLHGGTLCCLPLLWNPSITV